MSAASIAPFDAPNRRTIAQGHPPDWQPPRPKDVYELAVVGGGPCGLTAVGGSQAIMQVVQAELRGMWAAGAAPQQIRCAWSPAVQKPVVAPRCQPVHSVLERRNRMAQN